ncbi:hypothetical protein HanXRQr2_Chr07g0311781 [Helianthus annuus]|uniref:Uncharacterized protein n=1 Tax=Helianthus annuus TaxID=4232 RepID=A0A9K3INY6_HELAN|nr:hypothetical protein HanXRQr2_Chr07g0311781 [Helianthus annuus]KAJ0906099.1 hypothetical protein HanPSC8_Chr07g0301661 [Helianthus annuus]
MCKKPSLVGVKTILYKPILMLSATVYLIPLNPFLTTFDKRHTRYQTLSS